MSSAPSMECVQKYWLTVDFFWLSEQMLQCFSYNFLRQLSQSFRGRYFS